MKTYTKSVNQWSLFTLFQHVNDGTLHGNLAIQRRHVWARKHQTMLMESVLQGIGFPEIILWQPAPTEEEFFLIDGKQRAEGNAAFFRDEIAIRINGKMKTYSKMTVNEKGRFERHQATVVIFQGGTLEDMGEVYKRFNNGIPLNPSEKRRVYQGPVQKFCDDLSRTQRVDGATTPSIFDELPISLTRGKHTDLVGYCFLLERSLQGAGRLCAIGTAPLNKLYHQQKAEEVEDEIGPVVSRVIGDIKTAFSGFPEVRCLKGGIFLDTYVFLSKALGRAGVQSRRGLISNERLRKTVEFLFENQETLGARDGGMTYKQLLRSDSYYATTIEARQRIFKQAYQGMELATA